MANVKTTWTSYWNTAFAPSASTYNSPLGVTYGAFVNTTNQQFNTMRPGGVFSNLRARAITNANNQTSTLRFSNNASNSNLVVSWAAGVTGVAEDTSDTDTVTDGDPVFFTMSVPSGSTGNVTLSLVQIDFLASSDTHTTLCGHGANTISTASITRYNSLTGTINFTTSTESISQIQFQHSCTLRNFRIRVTADARSSNTVHRVRKNGADGNQSISTTNTGVFEDTTNTDTVSSGDKICFSSTSGTGTGAHTVTNMGVDVENTSTRNFPFCTSIPYTQNSALTRYAYPGVLIGTATEADTQTKLYSSTTLENMNANVQTNTLNGTTTIRMRQNAANANPVVSVSSSSTGFFADDASTTTTAPNDLINFSIVTAGSSGSIVINTLYVDIEVAASSLFTASITESSISVSDSNTRVLTGIRAISESSISATDSNARLLTAFRTSAEPAISVSDSNTRKLSAFRTISESAISVSDSNTRKLTALRTLTESAITVSDSVADILKATRLLTESTISVSDSVVGQKVANLYPRSITESSISVSETVARSLIAFRTLSDTVSVSDSIARIQTSIRLLTESSIAVSETLARIKTIPRSIAEAAITVSDSLTRLSVLLRTLSEATITVSDSNTRTKTQIRTIAEAAITVSDTLARKLNAFRTLAETAITVSDSVADLLKAFRTLTESTISVSDAVSRVIPFSRTISEPAITVSDSLARSANRVRAIAEAAITVSDTVTKTLDFFRTLPEASISVSDSMTRRLMALRALAEPAISVSDTVARQLVPIIALFETVNVSDSIARVLTAKRALSEASISVSDILAAARMRVRLISEPAISVNDSIVRRLFAFRVLGETVFVSEVLMVVGPDYEVALYISDRGYSNPLRARIQFISRNEPYPVFYTYDSFNPDARPFNIVAMSVRLAQGEIGGFSMTIEDSAGIVDKAKIGLGVKVVVEVRKEFANPYFKLITGFVRRIKPLRPATGALLYQIDGYGSQVVFNERVVNFKRAAKRTAVDSTTPLSTDSQMKAYRLFTDLITATDILPLKRPSIQSTGGFELTEVSPEVTDFIAQIAPGLTDAATVANALAEITGAIWGTDANGNPFFRYPTQKHSGILVKDAPVSTDLAASTSVNLDSFQFDDSIDVSEGFANRIYVLNAVDTKSTASSSKGLGSTTLTLRGVAQQWTATDNNVTSAAFILSRVGNPVTTSGSISGKLRADNNGYPTGATLATFEIPISSIETSRSTIFVNDIKTKDGVINPGAKYWWYLLGTGLHDDSNTVRWHHDNDLSTPDRFSAQLPLTDADPTKPGEQLQWIRSVFGPVYAFSTFSSVRHILTQSDSESIKQYGLIEGVVDLPSFDDDATFQKALAKIIYTSAKPKRTYEYNRLTIPTQRLFYPGEMITVIDSKASLTSEKSVMAEIAEVNYNFDTSSNGIGCKYVDIRLIAFLDKALDDYMDTREC